MLSASHSVFELDSGLRRNDGKARSTSTETPASDINQPGNVGVLTPTSIYICFRRPATSSGVTVPCLLPKCPIM